MKISKFKVSGLSIFAVFAAQPAFAALVTTNFDLGGGKWLAQIKYDGNINNTGTGTWTVPVGVSSLNVLVVGGGGGGSNGGNSTRGHGGGGGGVYTYNDYNVSGGAVINVTIGIGGLGGVAAVNSGTGADGGTTKFANLWATGGQGATNSDVSTMGSASGGYSLNGGLNIIGVVAGTSAGSDTNGPVGGSGAGTAGVYGYGGAAGGNGLTSNIVSSIVAGQLGLPYDGGYYGGGGGAFNANGGLGGGGDGNDAIAYPGTNTLGGGGHAGQNSGVGGAGGDGVIYISYTMIPEPSAALLGGLGMLALLRRRRVD